MAPSSTRRREAIALGGSIIRASRIAKAWNTTTENCSSTRVVRFARVRNFVTTTESRSRAEAAKETARHTRALVGVPAAGEHSCLRQALGANRPRVAGRQREENAPLEAGRKEVSHQVASLTYVSSPSSPCSAWSSTCCFAADAACSCPCNAWPWAMCA